MENTMSGTTKRQFTHEYRAQAVKFVTEQGMNVSAAARKLGVPMQTYANWVVKSREGTLAAVDTRRLQPVSELQAEVSRLKRELAVACEERDILKKATAYFAKQSK
jgi:transposase